MKNQYGTDDGAAASLAGRHGIACLRQYAAALSNVSRATRGAFRDPVAERKVIDFDEFRNVDMADVVALLCQTVKQAAPRKLAVAFYGYPFEVAPGTGRYAVQRASRAGRLLKSPDVDVLCSPVSYLDRAAGGGGYFMAPVDSVHLHGKLWLVEDDTRTHLSAPDSGTVARATCEKHAACWPATSATS